MPPESTEPLVFELAESPALPPLCANAKELETASAVTRAIAESFMAFPLASWILPMASRSVRSGSSRSKNFPARKFPAFTSAPP
jgi:hypothetical protein